jgi:hypothetical protein
MIPMSVVICAFTERRWRELADALASVGRQTLAPHEVIVVIDHNDDLLRRVREAWPEVLVSREPPGLSGARNTGVAVASGAIVAFLDDDAVAEPRWLELLAAAYADPDVLAAGGTVEPAWPDRRPPWFPPEYDWVVGCTHCGMPRHAGPVRNLVGANMSLRRDVLLEVGGFRHGIGRVGSTPVDCEETEPCIRAHGKSVALQSRHRRGTRDHRRVSPTTMSASTDISSPSWWPRSTTTASPVSPASRCPWSCGPGRSSGSRSREASRAASIPGRSVSTCRASPAPCCPRRLGRSAPASTWRGARRASRPWRLRSGTGHAESALAARRPSRHRGGGPRRVLRRARRRASDRLEPGAVVFHEHRRGYDELAAQLYWHGIGLSAYLTRCLATRPAHIPSFVRRLPRGLAYGFGGSSPRNHRLPARVDAAEWRGVLLGPLAYVKGLPLARRIRATQVDARVAVTTQPRERPPVPGEPQVMSSDQGPWARSWAGKMAASRHSAGLPDSVGPHPQHALDAVVGLVLWVAAARLYPTDVVGLGAGDISAFQLVAMIGWVGLIFTLMRYVPVTGTARRRLVLGVYAAGIGVAVVTAAVFTATLVDPAARRIRDGRAREHARLLCCWSSS